MLQWLRSLFGRQQAPKPEPRPDPVRQRLVEANQEWRARYLKIKARYDAAQTNEDNRRHWGNADGLSAQSANSAGVRRILRNRSRYEECNNGYADGMIGTRADDLVSTGPTLQLLSEDEGANEQVERLFADWARAVRLAEKLHCMDQARCRDGEAFALLVNNDRLAGPVKLDLLLVEADQVASPYGEDYPQELPGGRFQLDGIEYDAVGNPLFYTILRDHPGDLLRVYPLESRREPARNVLHWMRMKRPGQLRGVPELTSALPLFAYLRRWTLATLSAAEIAASFAAMLETVAPPDETDPPEPFESLEIERGMLTTLPAGSTMKQLEAEHPTSTYGDFKREVLAESARPLRMPINVVSGDSSQHNFSSAKLDHFGYRGGLKVDRAHANICILDRIKMAWMEEAIMVKLLPTQAMDLPHAWYWPGWPSMDKDEAQHVTERLANGTTTLQEESAADGMDWKDRVRQRGRELKLMKAEGTLPPAVPEKGSSDVQKMEKTAAPVEANGFRGNGHSLTAHPGRQ